MATARHLLAYAQTLRGGGVERALLRLARDWLALGRRVTLVLGTDDGPLAAELPEGLQTVVLGDAGYSALARAVPRVVAERAPDLIFCPGSHYTGVALATRLRLGRRCPPIVAKVSNAPERGDHGAGAAALHRAWLRLHPRFLDRLVAMTPATRRQVIAATGMAAERVAVIPNPPARPLPGAPQPALPERFILGVGRLAPQKRWDRLVAALTRLADRAVPLVILGEGPDRAALVTQARELGVEGRLVLPGYAADPMPAMAGAAVVALTSDFEGVPGVLREALAMGTPVVATDCSPAVREIVADRSLGDVVARDDTEALVVALDRWLAVGAVRPRPVPPPGDDAGARYLALFDALLSSA